MNQPPPRGSATLLVLSILTLLTIYAVVNGRALAQLGRELRQLDEQQIRRHLQAH